ncbi:PIN domain-containing protein [Kribbella sp. VKM Ac-2569]|uniref:PIN domain-containing protein n=1 Tax=Kribbella sp. VKM Ac-2569 TaxID=2512220 RepID=UPI00102C336A|nr:PIN domain-containing protein [Kribbella sp. VKM Ac-2569]RZT20181.1 PIN domain-containing protein [Kribbella sp. VKM Ac-2569]
MADRPRAFLDACVLHGQLTTDVILTLAHARLLTPKWSAQVLEEVKRNRPEGLPAERIDARFARMNQVFPAAMTSEYEALVPEMQADEKDKHVLAAAIHSRATVLVTENTKDFWPSSAGRDAIKVERTSEFLNRLLKRSPDRVIAALDSMVARNRREPRTMPELIDVMASRLDLEGFAHTLNEVVPEHARGSHPRLQTAHAVQTATSGVVSPVDAAQQAPVQPAASKAVRTTGKEADRET